MSRKASLAIVALAALILGVPSLASAVVVSFNTSGTFLNPSLEPSPPPSSTSGVGTDTFGWGAGSDPSSLQFSGTSPNLNVAPGTSQYFFLGTLDFYNGVIPVNTGANGVQLQIGLDFVTLPDQLLTVDLAIANVLNPAPDTVSLSGPALSSPWASTTFSDGGYSYTFDVIGFWPWSEDVSGGKCCHGDVDWSSLTVGEDCDISAKLKGKLTVVEQPIPEPATMLLVGCGLLGLAWRRRRS
jgi:hypothetical protein